MTSRLTRLMSLPVLTLAVGTGCVVVDADQPLPPRDFYGDISFLWSFDGLVDCDAAAVDEVDIAIFQDGALIDEINNEPCVGGGLTLLNYFEGRYEVEIDAYARNDELLYSGGFTTRVVGGTITDAGVITLAYYGDEPIEEPARTGDVAFLWSFLYPTDEAIIACDVAGVREIDVRLTSPGLQDVAQSFDCDEEGAIFSNLLTGVWTLELDAYGTYHTDGLHLYAASVDFTVRADTETDLGDINLERDEDHFADIDVKWGFNGTTCAEEGITDVIVAVKRGGLAEAEESITRPCTDLGKLLSTFVPGTYDVSATGVGRNATWRGAVLIDVAPDTIAEAPLQLAPQAR